MRLKALKVSDFNEVIMARNHVVDHNDAKKNLARERFLSGFSEAAAKKFRQMLDEHKAKEKGK